MTPRNSRALNLCIGLIFVLLLPAAAMAASYMVSGTGDPEADGVYVQTGSNDGVPRYEQTGTGWYLQREDPLMTTVNVTKIWTLNSGILTWFFTEQPQSGVTQTPPAGALWYRYGGNDDPPQFNNPVPELTVTLILEPASVPTLGSWGATLLILLTGVLAAWVLIRRKQRT